MKRTEIQTTAILQAVELLETALVDYAVKYGLTDIARQALRKSDEVVNNEIESAR